MSEVKRNIRGNIEMILNQKELNEIAERYKNVFNPNPPDNLPKDCVGFLNGVEYYLDKV